MITLSNMRRVPRDPSPELPPPPVVQPPPTHDSSDDDVPQYVKPAAPVNTGARNSYPEYNDLPPEPKFTQSRAPPPQSAPLSDRDRSDRVSDPAKLPFNQRVNLFKQSQNDQPRQDYKNYIK